MNEKTQNQETVRDARQLGIPKMLILGIQHMFAMFGATILVPILVAGYFQSACNEPLTRGLTVSVTFILCWVLVHLYSIYVPNLKYLHF